MAPWVCSGESRFGGKVISAIDTSAPTLLSSSNSRSVVPPGARYRTPCLSDCAAPDVVRQIAAAPARIRMRVTCVTSSLSFSRVIPAYQILQALDRQLTRVGDAQRRRAEVVSLCQPVRNGDRLHAGGRGR